VWGDYFGYSGIDQTSLFVAGTDEADYSTDVEAAQAETFIRETDGPLFVYVGFDGVHDPFTPAPRHHDAFSGLPDWRPPSYDEADTSDKPEWVAHRERLDAAARAEIDRVRADQYRSLLAIDQGVREIVRALEDTGRLSTSLIVFTSDNGFTWGEHRLFGKGDPYEESIRVPMVVRFDPVVRRPGRSDDELVLNIDIAPTVRDVTGVDGPPMDGRSLVPLLDGSADGWRSHFLTMKMGNEMPSFCQIHTATRALTAYETGEQEDYALASDPFELRNLAGTSKGKARRAALRRMLADRCDPPPPDMSW
jgi:arylsulfatase A-like enzyme